MKNVFFRLLWVLVACLLAVGMTACNGTGNGQETEYVTFDAYATDKAELNADMVAIAAEIDSMRVGDFAETVRKTQYVKITVRDFGDVIIRLREDIAPETVENFCKLVSEGFYDGLIVHRVVKDFVIQTGDPKGDGSGGSTQPVLGEFSANGVKNDLSHIRGVVSMARKGDGYNTATSQFMICNSDKAASSLDGVSAAFGYVVAGLEVVLTVSEVEVTLGSGEVSRPVEPVIIEKICFVYKK